MDAWNGWYHVNGNTYGTWLRGDPRGWRARWHREHVEGDYRNPPPKGAYAKEYAFSKRSLKRPPVRLDSEQRRVAGRAMVQRLLETDVELLALSVDTVHYHILARFPDTRVRWWVGRAKKNASFLLRIHGLPGTVWARKCRALPLTSRSHQQNVFRYIAKHADKGAWTWTFREGLYWLDDSDGLRIP